MMKFGFFCVVLLLGAGCVSAVDTPYNQLHYQITTKPLPDLVHYTGNYTSIGDHVSFTAYFYGDDGGQALLSKFVNVTDTRRPTEEGFIDAPSKLGYLIIGLDTGVYDISGTKWTHIMQKCPGNTTKGEERAFWFDPAHPLNATFIFEQAQKESRFDGISHFRLRTDGPVTIETLPKKKDE
jgi:hypothetical protein